MLRPEPLDAQPDRRSVRNGQVLPVHAVGQQSLRMPGIGHIEAVPPSIDAIKEDIPGLRLNSGGTQNKRERNACPLGNCRPAIFAYVLRDLRA